MQQFKNSGTNTRQDNLKYDVYIFQFLVGRLLDFVTDIAFSERLLVVSYLESRTSIITFGKNLEFPGTPSCSQTNNGSTNSSGGNFENISQCDPKIHVHDLLGPPARRYLNPSYSTILSAVKIFLQYILDITILHFFNSFIIKIGKKDSFIRRFFCGPILVVDIRSRSFPMDTSTSRRRQGKPNDVFS